MILQLLETVLQKQILSECFNFFLIWILLAAFRILIVHAVF
jgi:hypothetical protein